VAVSHPENSQKQKRTTRMEGPERRELILKAATQVFVRENYYGATTAKIAAAAGISEPVIYSHFKSKKDLFLEVLKKSHEGLLNWNAKVLNENADPIKRYQAFTDMYKYYTTQANRDSEIVWAVAAGVNDPDIKRQIRQADEEIVEQLADNIRQAMEAGEINSRHAPQALARIIHGINAHLAWLILVGETHTQDWIYEEIKRLIEDVMKKE